MSMKIDMGKRKQRLDLLKELESHTGKNVVVYYSLSASSNLAARLGISKNENEDLKKCLTGVGGNKGMILLLRTPGGLSDEAEKMIRTLKEKSNQDLTVIVPEEAMSSGTVMACSSREIIMGEHSSLGPTDLQFSFGPIGDLIYDIDQSLQKLQDDPASKAFYKVLMKKYQECIISRLGKKKDAVESAFMDSNDNEWITLVTELKADLESFVAEKKKKMISILGYGMFSEDDPDDQKRMKEIVDKLYDRQLSLTHNRRFDRETCKHIGLKIKDLEEDTVLQDLVLKINDTYMDFFARDQIVKIMESAKHTLTLAKNNHREFI